jgi:hypothetical protein
MLSTQKYSNTTRTITGLGNDIYPNDVIILCNTLPGPVAIDLQEIPANFWNTNYKLYIVDINNNAGANNITINAPAGYTINNNPNLIISVNGARGVITISSNTSYNCELNYSSAGGLLTIQDEGINVSSPCTLINFVGNYVIATGAGPNATVTINPNIVSLTYSGFLILSSGNNLVSGQFYSISNAIFTNSVLENVPVIVQAITNNSISLYGSAIFLNADYQNVGTYTSVPGFVANLGVWGLSLAPVIGDVVIWNNLHFVNLTGINAGPPDIDLVNWSVLAKTVTNGYIIEVDEVTYNVSTNQILTRKDKRDNYVENNLSTYGLVGNLEAFLVFQWGSKKCLSNKIQQESWSDFWNSNNEINYNSISQLSFIKFTRNNKGKFLYNTATNNSQLNVTNDGSIFVKNVAISATALLDNYSVLESNHFENVSQLTITNLSFAGVGVFSDNYIYGNYISTLTISITNEGTVTGNYIFNTDLVADNQGMMSQLNRNRLENSVIQFSNNSNSITENIITQESNVIISQNTGAVSYNFITVSSVFIVQSNFGQIVRNEVSQSSSINVEINNTNISQNIISSGSSITVLTSNDSFVANNILESLCTISFNVLDPGTFFTNNVISTGSIIITSFQNNFSFNNWKRLVMNVTNFIAQLNNTSGTGGNYANITHNLNVDGGIYQNGVGTIKYELDMSDPAVFNLVSNALSIPGGYVNFFGEYNLVNNAGYTIDYIINLSQSVPTRFTCGNGVITINIQPVGIALPSSIISSTPVTPLLLTQRLDGNDSVVIKGLGQLNGVEQINLYI